MEYLTGTIEHGPSGLVLRVDGGGTWELENTSAIRQLVGSHVEVFGYRSGFNGLVCDQIRVAGQLRSQGYKLRLEFLVAASVVAYGLYVVVTAAIGAFG